MEPYKPWDFCRDTGCKSYKYPGIIEERILFFCENCKAYQMHQYLQEQGQIIEEGNPLLQVGPKFTYEEQYLLDLIGQMSESWGPKLDYLAPGLQEIIKAYNKAFPKEVIEHADSQRIQ